MARYGPRPGGRGVRSIVAVGEPVGLQREELPQGRDDARVVVDGGIDGAGLDPRRDDDRWHADAWHASVPGETWPNRNFLHAGTSDGTVEIEPGFYESPTIFEQLEEAGHTWRIYFDAGIPHVWVFKNLWDEHERWANWFLFDGVSDLDPGFEAHVAAGDLPYSFIESSRDAQALRSAR